MINNEYTRPLKPVHITFFLTSHLNWNANELFQVPYRPIYVMRWSGRWSNRLLGSFIVKHTVKHVTLKQSQSWHVANHTQLMKKSKGRSYPVTTYPIIGLNKNANLINSNLKLFINISTHKQIRNVHVRFERMKSNIWWWALSISHEQN